MLRTLSTRETPAGLTEAETSPGPGTVYQVVTSLGRCCARCARS